MILKSTKSDIPPNILISYFRSMFIPPLAGSQVLEQHLEVPFFEKFEVGCQHTERSVLVPRMLCALKPSVGQKLSKESITNRLCYAPNIIYRCHIWICEFLKPLNTLLSSRDFCC